MRIFIALILSITIACAQPNKPKAPVIAVENGVIIMADTTAEPIPHFKDSSYIILFCVRHCEKVKDGTKDPVLTATGESRAKALGKILSFTRIDRICTTTFQRTLMTGEAIRDRAPNHPTIETYPADMQEIWLESILAAGGGKRYAVVGHSNTIPLLINSLTGKKTLEDLPEDAYDRLFIIATKGIGEAEVWEGKY